MSCGSQPSLRRGAVRCAPLAVFAATAAAVLNLGPSHAAEPDARLERAAPRTQEYGELLTYLKRLSAETGVEHAARDRLATRPLVALRTYGSLRRQQHGLRALYAASWQRSAGVEPRYTLVLEIADLRERERAALDLRTAARRRLLDRWRAVSRLAFLPPGALVRAAPTEPDLVRCLQHPRYLAAARAGFSLPMTMVQQAIATGRASTPVVSLPSELQSLAKTAWRGDSADRTGDEVLSGTAQLRLGGTPQRLTVWLQLLVGQEGVDTNLLYAEGWTRQPPQERRREAQSRPTPVPKDPRFRTKVTLREPASRAGLQPGERPPGAKPLGALLKELSEQVDLPLLAEVEHRLPKDDPDGRWLRKQWWLAADLVKRPLPEVLDMLCADFECEWRFEHGFLLIRPRLWFLEPEEREYVFPK
jgi:hypothetical protein